MSAFGALPQGKNKPAGSLRTHKWAHINQQNGHRVCKVSPGAPECARGRDVCPFCRPHQRSKIFRSGMSGPHLSGVSREGPAGSHGRPDGLQLRAGRFPWEASRLPRGPGGSSARRSGGRLAEEYQPG
jgi:hypothetical protein